MLPSLLLLLGLCWCRRGRMSHAGSRTAFLSSGAQAGGATVGSAMAFSHLAAISEATPDSRGRNGETRGFDGGGFIFVNT
jgi:hypothetical protein